MSSSASGGWYVNVLHLHEPDGGAEVRDLPQEQTQRLGYRLAEIPQWRRDVVEQDQYRLHEGVKQNGQQRFYKVIRYQLEYPDCQRPDHAVEHEA